MTEPLTKSTKRQQEFSQKGATTTALEIISKKLYGLKMIRKSTSIRYTSLLYILLFLEVHFSDAHVLLDYILMRR